MNELMAFIPMEYRHALAHGAVLPDRTNGAALFADISGFTPLTAAFSQELGPQRGAEELTYQLSLVFSSLTEIVHTYRGSIIGFSGDAMTCWFDQAAHPQADAACAAAAAALAMQETLLQHASVITPAGQRFPLGVKVAVVAGPARRFVVGRPDIRRLEALAGATLDRMAAAEHVAERGEVVVGAEVVDRLEGAAIVREWRSVEDAGRFAVLDEIRRPITTAPWPAVPVLDTSLTRSWLLQPVYQRLARGEGEFAAALRPVTPLFVNFSGIDYDTDDEAGRKLDAYIGWVQEVLSRHEGYLIELTMGDKGSYLHATFGAFVAHEDEPLRAVSAAMELLSLPDELRYVREMRIGISQGQAYVGDYGGPAQRTYGVLGNETNLAARLMGRAQPGQILVAPRVAKAVSTRYDVLDLGAVSLKGLPEPLTLFAVKGKRSAPAGVDRDAGQATELFGREEEQALLDEGLALLLQRQSGVMVLEGEAGIGKSRLVEYLVQQARLAGVESLLGAGDSIDKFTPYHAWQPVFRQFFRLDSPIEEVNAALRTAWRSQVRAHLDALDAGLAELAPLLNAVLPLDFAETERTRQLDGKVRADNINNLLVRLLQNAAASSPLMIVLEDVHWLDSASWTLARLAAVDVQPLLLALASRPLSDQAPVEYAALLALPAARLVRLEPLSPQQIEALICARLEVRSLPEPVAALIRKRAEGHPFYSEELAYALRDARLIQIDGGECRLAPGVDNLLALDFPDTIQGVITSRIDNLPSQQQLTVKVASVIGRIFGYRILSEIHPVEADRQDLLDQLSGLEKLDITLLEKADPDLSYLFKHILTQEVAYNLLLFRQRFKLHQDVAKWYERTQGNELSPFYGLLAYHWTKAAADQHESAELTFKAIDYLEKAGEQAMRNYANAEALRYFREAVDLDAAYRGERSADTVFYPPVTTAQLRSARWHRRMAEAQLALGNLGECEQEAKLALALLGRPMPDEYKKLAAKLFGQLGAQAGQRMMLRKPGSATLSEAERTVLIEIAGLYWVLAKARYHSNEPLPILYANASNLNVSERIGPSSELAIVYGNVMLTLGVFQMHPLARSYGRRGLEVARGTQQPDCTITVLIANGLYRVGLGDWIEARRYLEEARELSQKRGDYGQWGNSMGVLADSALFAGDMPRSLQLYDELRAQARRMGNRMYEGWSMRSRVVQMLRQGCPQEAAQALDEAVALQETVVDPLTKIDTYGLLAVARWRLGQTAAALEAAAVADQLIAALAPPVAYPQYLGYGGAAEVYLDLWERSLTVPTLVPRGVDVAALARQACKNLNGYRRVFPMGGGQAGRYQGWHAWLSGKQRDALGAWQKGLKAAEATSMPYEQAMIRYHMGRRLPVGDAQRQAHLQRALDILLRLDATYDAGRVVAELNRG